MTKNQLAQYLYLWYEYLHSFFDCRPLGSKLAPYLYLG